VAVDELDQSSRHATECLSGGELDSHAVGVAEAPHQAAQECEREARPTLDHRPELRGRDRDGLDGLQCLGGARPRSPVDHGKLTHKIARAAELQHDLPALRGGDRNLHPA
jgi:hypothetical protein